MAAYVQPVKDVEWAIGINRMGLKVSGLWRNEHYSHWRNTLSNLLVPLYIMIMLTFTVFPQSLALIKVWGNLTLMTENLITSVPITVAICKVGTIWCKKKVINTMMSSIIDDWSKSKTDQEQEVMIKYARSSKMITMGAYLAIVTTVLAHHPPIVLGIVLRTVTNITDPGSRVLVLPSIYPFDVYETPIYELIVFSHTMTCSLAGFYYSTVGSLFGALVLHVCSQLENLKLRLEQMLTNDHVKQNDFQECFSLNIREHQRLIRFVDMIENTFSAMLLYIVPAFTITFCVQGFQLISNARDGVERPVIQILFCIAYMSFTALVMFVYSSVGELLTVQGKEIQYAAYNCEWYNLQPKEAAQLIVIMVRAQRPLQITAGKFVPLTLGTFATLLKTTAGYISCLLACQEI